MTKATRDRLAKWQGTLRSALSRHEVLALFPILVLVSYDVGGPRAVVAAAMLLPSLLVLANIGIATPHAHIHEATAPAPRGAKAGRRAMQAMLERIARMDGMDSACFLLGIDDWAEVTNRWGRESAQDIVDCCTRRLRGVLRQDDLLADLGGGVFGIVLRPIASARLGIRDGIADRLRTALSEPLLVDAATLRLTASAGHAALRPATPETAVLALEGAECALEEARQAGQNMVRAFVPGTGSARTRGVALAEEVDGALEDGAICPWFQPQVDARTGRVSGFEALARWQHPALGLLAPQAFLDAVSEAGRLDALGGTIRRQAFDAFGKWLATGVDVMTVSVNASETELRNPGFADQVAWDLDLMDLAPERLVLEVLETVAANARDERVLATLKALRSHGIGLDLDDFGVGQASLLSIRRFGIGRIKIDRSFVMGVDADPEQQALVGAIVSMAREMGLRTLAEGVETEAERDMLVRMGCDDLQGFLIGKPMPLDETFGWLADQAARMQADAVAVAHPAG